MFYWEDDSKWLELDAAVSEQTIASISRLSGQQEGTERNPFVWSDAYGAADHGLSIPVDRIARTRLRLDFYRSPCWLIKLTCRHGPGVFPDYRSAEIAYRAPLAFAVVRCKTERFQAEAIDGILLINWNALTIYAFNSETGLLDLGATEERAQGKCTDRVRDYLRFFSGFIQGENGPFLCVESAQELKLDDATAMPDMFQLLKDGGYVPGIDDFDEPRHSDTPSAPSLPGEFTPEAIHCACADAPQPGVDPVAPDLQGGEREPFSPPTVTSFDCESRVIYGDLCFAARLSIDASGIVEMHEDFPIAQNAAWAAYETREARNGTVLLLRRAARRQMLADELWQTISRAGVGMVPLDLPEPRSSADQLAASAARTIEFNNLRIVGTCDFKGLSAVVPIEFRHVEFMDDLVLDEARFSHSLSFSRCMFARRVSLRSARLQGGLTVSDCKLLGHRDAPVEYALSLQGLQSGGDVTLTDCRITGPMNFRMMQTGGSVLVSRLRHLRRSGNAMLNLPQDDPLAMCLDMSLMRVGGTWRFEDKVGAGGFKRAREPMHSSLCGQMVGKQSSTPEILIDGLKVTGGMNLAALECSGDVMLSDMHIGRPHTENQAANADSHVVLNNSSVQGLALTRVRVDGWLQLASAHVSDMVQFESIRLGGNLDMTGCICGGLSAHDAHVAKTLELGSCVMSGMCMLTDSHIGNNLILSGGKFASDVDLTDTSILGNLHFFTGQVGRLMVADSSVQERVLSLQPGSTRERPPQPLAGAGTAGLGRPTRKVRVGGAMISNVMADQIGFVGIDFFGGNDCRYGISGSVQLDFVTVKASLSFFINTERFILPERFSCQDLSTQVAESIRLRNCAVGGHLILSNTLAAGQISITDCTLDGDLRMEGAHALSTHCGSLDLENTTIGRDADLTGLDCRLSQLELRTREAGMPARVQDATTGLQPFREGINGRGLTVRGRMLLVPEAADIDSSSAAAFTAKPDAKESGRIPGKVDLSNSELNMLRLCGDIFRDPHASARDGPDVKFFGARVRLFDLAQPFPEQVDMRGLRVERWHGLEGDAYLSMLRRMVPLDTSVYTAVEHSLRIEGQDAMADKVYRAMRRRMVYPWLKSPQEKTGASGAARWARVFLELLKDGSSGFWTNPWRLLYLLILPLWLVALAAGSVPENFVAQDETGRANRACLPVEGAMARSLTYAVPIIDVQKDRDKTSGAECVLRTSGSTHLGNFAGRRWIVPHMSPHAVMLTVAILGWILWPLFLIGLSGLVRGRAKSAAE
ncbi:MAG: hypothetical protein Q7J36_09860 [Thiobacillus sp.]|nr:hypothetical protein [Thiobacillus sp.]